MPGISNQHKMTLNDKRHMRLLGKDDQILESQQPFLPLEENDISKQQQTAEPASIPAKGDTSERTESSKDVEKEPEKHPNNNVIIAEEVMVRETRFSRWIESIEERVDGLISKHSDRIRLGIYCILLVLYLFYFGYCMFHRYGDEGSTVLIVITVLLLWKIFFKILDSRGIEVGFPQSFHTFAASKSGTRFRNIIRYLAYVAATGSMITYLAIDVFPQNATNLQSFLGMVAMIFLCFVFSAKPSKVNWHPVFWAFSIQFVVAFITLRTQIGYDMFKWLGDLVQTLFKFSDAGSAFVIGKEFHEWGLALSASGVIIFTNALVFLMNHWGVIEFIVLKLGGFLAFCLDTGRVESVVAAANIFIGLAEAPLLIRPYLPTITKSELHTVMTCGFASISGGIMALLIQLGAPAHHLLTAAVISAPAALAISKLMYPETERVQHQSQSNIRMVDKKESNSLNAFSEGAVMGVGICAAVWSNMLAFVSILSLMDALAGWAGDRAGVEGLSFGVICSYVLFPLAYLMGVDVSDCRKVGELIGIKLFATPVVGYQELGYLIENRAVFEDYISSSNGTAWSWEGDDILLELTNTTLKGGVILERTEVIATYAMCGFSAFTAIGICLGALLPLCPPRKQDIVNLIVRAFVAGNMASFATGAIAGVLFTTGTFS